MKVNFLRTATIAGLLISLSSSPLLAFKIEKETQESLSSLMKDPEVINGLSTLVKESLNESRDVIKDVIKLIKEINQLIEKGGPIADNIIARISTEQRKDEVLKAENLLKFEEARLKIEQEKQKTERRKADLNYKRDSSYTGICLRGLKAIVSWPAAFTTLGLVGICKLGVPFLQNAVIPAITKVTKEKD